MNQATERPGQREAAERQRQRRQEIIKKFDQRSSVTVFVVMREQSSGRHHVYIPLYTTDWKDAYDYAIRHGQGVGFTSLYHAEESGMKYLCSHDVDRIRHLPVVPPGLLWRMG